MIHTAQAAIECAPTGVTADLIRDGVLIEIAKSSAAGDTLLELFRRGATEIALLATIWHELAQSNDLTTTVRPDDLQHLMSEAFQGRAAIVNRSSGTQSRSPDGKPMQGRHLVMRCAADITPEPISWLWPHRMAIGKLTLLA